MQSTKQPDNTTVFHLLIYLAIKHLTLRQRDYSLFTLRFLLNVNSFYVL